MVSVRAEAKSCINESGSKTGIWLCWEKTEDAPLLQPLPGEPSSAGTAGAGQSACCNGTTSWRTCWESPHSCSQSKDGPEEQHRLQEVILCCLSFVNAVLGRIKGCFCPAKLRKGWLWDLELHQDHTHWLLGGLLKQELKQARVEVAQENSLESSASDQKDVHAKHDRPAQTSKWSQSWI